MLSITLRNLAVIVLLMSWTGPAGAQPTRAVPFCEERMAPPMDTILRNWSDRLAPTLPSEEHRSLEKYVAEFPQESEQGVLPVSFDYTEVTTAMNIRPVVSRRDWAYAFEGFRYTLTGGTVRDSEALLDLGFWAFLQAALLEAEPDHLANVGFHLNNRGAFEDAVVVLCHGLTRTAAHPGIHNNLAFALANLGETAGALSEQASAVALRPENARYRDRLATYGAQLGLDPASLKQPAPGGASAPHAGGGNVIPLSGDIVRLAVEFQQRLHAGTGPDVYSFQDISQDFGQLQTPFRRTLNANHQKYIRCQQACGDARNTVCHCNCTISHLQTLWQSMTQMVFDLAPLVERYEKFGERELIATKDRMVAILMERDATPDPKTRLALYRQIYDWYLGARNFPEGWRVYLQGHLMSVSQTRRMLDGARRECARSIRESQPPFDPADYFGRRPRTIVLRDLNAESDKPWHIWFAVGSLDLHPDDTAALSFGFQKVLSAKFKYNFRTHEFGSGIAVGLNLGKPFGPVAESVFSDTMKIEFFAEVDSVNGPRAGIETGLNPRVGVLHTDQQLVLRLEN